jgi:hypothetical protein
LFTWSSGANAEIAGLLDSDFVDSNIFHRLTDANPDLCASFLRIARNVRHCQIQSFTLIPGDLIELLEGCPVLSEAPALEVIYVWRGLASCTEAGEEFISALIDSLAWIFPQFVTQNNRPGVSGGLD